MPSSFLLQMIAVGLLAGFSRWALADVMAAPVFECSDPGYRSFLHQHQLQFEVGQVHPLDRSADGHWLYVLNTPLNCLEIYQVNPQGLKLAGSVAVGLQPVSVRARNAHEIWVVNHLSDNVSVIDLKGLLKIRDTESLLC